MQAQIDKLTNEKHGDAHQNNHPLVPVTDDGEYIDSSWEEGCYDGNFRIWKCKVPSTVKIFTYLVLQEKILTHDVMERRNMRCDLQCIMCQNCLVETSLHMFFLCPYAVQVWWEVANTIKHQLMKPEACVQLVWAVSSENTAGLSKEMKERWRVYFICTCCLIRKQRNQRIFGGRHLEATLLADRVIQEGKLWLKLC